MDALEPGELASLSVTFIEDRSGRAVVRLPNGSKTTVDYDGLRRIGGSAHFARATNGTGESVFCREVDCDWTTDRSSRVDAEDAYIEHLDSEHPGTRRT
jgi:hypothetical protein